MDIYEIMIRLWAGLINALLSNHKQNFLCRCLWLKLRDYMSNIWGNVRIAIMGAGQGVWPKIFFLVHMTMSTGSLASPPPRGGDS